jgi:hypothetical protein
MNARMRAALPLHAALEASPTLLLAGLATGTTFTIVLPTGTTPTNDQDPLS